jgi:cell division septal protein FtsQ
VTRLLPPWIDDGAAAAAAGEPVRGLEQERSAGEASWEGAAAAGAAADEHQALSGLGLSGLARGSGGRVLDFRRRGAPPRRRRRSLLVALARPLGVALLAVGLPAGVGGWVLSSGRFQLRAVAVSYRVERPPAGNPALPAGAEAVAAAAAVAGRRVPAAWVQQAVLGRFAGRNLVQLPLDEVRQRLAANPWVAAVDVAKQLPDRLRVTIAERRPVVLLRSGTELVFADATGRAIAPVGARAEQAAARRQGLLVLSFPPSMWRSGAPLPGGPSGGAVDAQAGALRVAEQLRRLRPAWAAALAEIEVVDEEDYQLHVEGLPCPLLVRGSWLADNLVRFEQLLPDLRRRYPALSGVDLRFARRIVVQPAAAAPPSPTPQPPRAEQAGVGA